MENTFKPFKGINTISFNDERQKIREKINLEYKEIKRNEFAENTSDYYEQLGFFVGYSNENLCDAIEFTNESNLYYNGENLLSLTYSSLRNTYDKNSSNKEEEEEVGVTYYDLGFGLTKEFETDKIESIIIFSENYW